MQTPLTIPQRDHLAAYLQALDSQINQLTFFCNSTIETGSIMLAGYSAGSEYKKILAFTKYLPPPAASLKRFLAQYSSDLLALRNNIVEILEAGTTEFTDVQRHHVKCESCVSITMHRNYYIIPSCDDLVVSTSPGWFICNQCDTIIKLPR